MEKKMCNKKGILFIGLAMLALPSLAGTCSYSFGWFCNNAVADFQVPVTLEEGVSGFSYAGVADGGSDLRVSDGSSNLPYEIENWNPAGKSVVWVKVPNFSSATVLTFSWGADAAGVEAADAAGFWDEAFAVVHFGGDTAVNSVNGDVLGGAMVPETSMEGCGVAMDKANVLTKTDSPVEAYASTSNQLTISFWIKTDARMGGSANDGTYLFQWGPSNGQRALLLNWNNDGVFSFYNYQNVTGSLPGNGNMKILDGNWHHFAFTYNGATLVAYRDGYQVASQSANFSYSMPDNGGSYFSIGGTHGGLHLFRGTLDEVRFENVCRGADYIRACVETQSRAVPGGSATISFADYTGPAIENFPVYVQVDANSGVVPESFYQSLLNGTSHIRDLRTNALLPIDVEHAFFNSFDDTLGFWTLMPRYSSTDGLSLSASFDCYRPGVSADAELNPIGPAGVWNPDDYLLVFHMNPTGLLHDVVHNVQLAANCRGTDNRLGGFPVAVDGPTGPYAAYRSTTNAVQRNSNGVSIDHAFTNVFTISWWMKQDADECASPKRETYVWNVFSVCALEGAGYSGHGANANRIAMYPNMTKTQIDIPDAGWHHYAYASDGRNTYCYRDGELVTTASQVKNFECASGVSGKTVMLMSSSNPVKDAFRGCGDEFRVEAVCRGADWIRASYHNQLAWRDGIPWQLVPHFAKAVSAEAVEGTLTAAAALSCRTNATVTMFWGATDGGKYPQYWTGSVNLGLKSDGAVQAQAALPATGGRFACRFRAENNYGTAWSDVRYVEVLPTGRPRVFEFAVAYTGSETLTDFPLCVRVPASLELPAEKGRVRFTDAAGKVLAWEAETWNPAGESVVWVRMPQLAAGATVRLEFRNNWETSGAWSAGEVWKDGDYVGVYHFEPDTGVVTRDSSAIANNVIANTLNGKATNGVAGTAFWWAGDGNGMTRGVDAGKDICDFRNGFTMSGWIRVPSDSPEKIQAFVKHELRSQGDLGSGYYLQYWMAYTGGVGGNVYLRLYAQNSLFTPNGLTFGGFGIADCGCSTFFTTASDPLKMICSAACPDDDWHHYAFTHDGMFLRAYRDGELLNEAFWPFILNAGFLDHKLMSTGFGNNVSSYECARGSLDEYRAERVGRSSAWIKACYDNQKPGSTFVTFSRAIIPALTIIFR